MRRDFTLRHWFLGLALRWLAIPLALATLYRAGEDEDLRRLVLDLRGDLENYRDRLERLCGRQAQGRLEMTETGGRK